MLNSKPGLQHSHSCINHHGLQMTGSKVRAKPEICYNPIATTVSNHQPIRAVVFKRVRESEKKRERVGGGKEESDW